MARPAGTRPPPRMTDDRDARSYPPDAGGCGWCGSQPHGAKRSGPPQSETRRGCLQPRDMRLAIVLLTVTFRCRPRGLRRHPVQLVRPSNPVDRAAPPLTRRPSQRAPRRLCPRPDPARRSDSAVHRTCPRMVRKPRPRGSPRARPVDHPRRHARPRRPPLTTRCADAGSAMSGRDVRTRQTRARPMRRPLDRRDRSPSSPQILAHWRPNRRPRPIAGTFTRASANAPRPPLSQL